jgi:hypothetical protein
MIDLLFTYLSPKFDIHFITYGTNHFLPRAIDLAKKAETQFKRTQVYSKEDIDDDFREANDNILSRSRGDGYWLWKPHIINKALANVKRGDILVYCDASYDLTGDLCSKVKDHFVKNKGSYAYVLKDHHFVHKARWTEVRFSKGDAFARIGVDMNNMSEPLQAWAGFIALRKCSESCQLVSDWLKYGQDPQIITDDISIVENHVDFVDNRHDQTALSLLCKKKNIKFHAFNGEGIIRRLYW